MELIDSLLSVLASNPLPNEFDFIHNDECMAKVCIEQGDDGGLKLGIPAEKTPFVYLETRKELLTDDGLPICDFTKFDDRRPLLAACLLLIQGDFPVIYSMRRQWVRDGKLVNLKRELDLIRLVLSKHRKSISGWNYRRWIIRQLLADDGKNFPDVQQQELQSCLQLAPKTPRNYFLWNYRRWLLIDSMTSTTMTSCNQELLMHDLNLLSKRLVYFISDSSAMSFHFNLMVMIATGESAAAEPVRPIWRNQIESIHDWIVYFNDGGSHETLWYYLRSMFAACSRLTALKSLMSPVEERQWVASIVDKLSIDGQRMANNYLRFIGAVVAV